MMHPNISILSIIIENLAAYNKLIMKLFALVALTSAVKISDHPAPSALVIDKNWVDYPFKNVQRPHQITNPAFGGDAKTDFDLSKEPSCPSYLGHYNCKSWTDGAVTGLTTQERPHTELSGR